MRGGSREGREEGEGVGREEGEREGGGRREGAGGREIVAYRGREVTGNSLVKVGQILKEPLKPTDHSMLTLLQAVGKQLLQHQGQNKYTVHSVYKSVYM